MRLASTALALLFVPGLALAQDRGVALNMGRGLDNGMSVNWTFKENWTLRPTIGAGYSQFNGFEAALGSTILRSIGGIEERFYAYVGAGAYFGSANAGAGSSIGSVSSNGGVGRTNGGGTRGNQLNTTVNQNAGSILYVTAPVGVRGRIFGNFEAFAEAAYQKTLSGQFGSSQTGQFSGNGKQRFGATFGISLRLQ